MLDILIEKGRLLDGKNPETKTNVGIKNSRVVKVDVNLNQPAALTIHAEGLVVCPGFIDVHSHTDETIPYYSKGESFIRQGITTCTVGQCGGGLAPINPEYASVFKEDLIRWSPEYKSVDVSWRSFGEYLAAIEKKSVPFNLVFFVGYSNIRLAGGARHEDRQPRPDEMERMKQHVAEAMQAGAFGMSTGLIYSPQAYAETEELIELAKVVGEWNGLYFSHIRGEGETVLDAIRELIRIVEESGCRGGHIAHHKIADRVHWGLSRETLGMIREANERGLSITFDQYPYSRSMSSLITALPPWALEGGTEKILTRLRDPKLREEIKRDILEDNKRDTPGWENWVKIDGFENMYVIGIHHEKWKSVRGLSIPEITQRMGLEDNWETLFDILIDEECGVSVTAESMGEEDIRRIMKSEHQMFGTDGGAVPIDFNHRMVHPRYYGTYPRILGKYVREEGVLSLEEAIAKMTSLPAWRLGLEDRGHIAPGYWADIVVFDPDTVIDKATYEEPHQAPEGILHVIVNGELVVQDEVQLDVYPGQILRPKSTRKYRA